VEAVANDAVCIECFTMPVPTTSNYMLNSGEICLNGVNCPGQSGSPTNPLTFRLTNVDISCTGGTEPCGDVGYYGIYDLPTALPPGEYTLSLSLAGTAPVGLTGVLVGCVYQSGDPTSDCLSLPSGEVSPYLSFAPNSSGNISAGPLVFTVDAAPVAVGIEFFLANMPEGEADLIFANSADLTFTAVPEPATFGLVGAAILALARLTRKRRKFDTGQMQN
jgi:hypothetical protein